jgi:hypothetical protein
MLPHKNGKIYLPRNFLNGQDAVTITILGRAKVTMRISPISPVESYLETTIHCKAWKKKTENR